ncbi:MAG: hypothetical protein JSW27_03540, partial [Phycisphaerales bacterium]
MHDRVSVLRKMMVCAAVGIVACAGGALWAENSAPGPTFELLWTAKADPRAQPGMANKEDGITVECVEFSADGKLIAAGNGQGQVKIYDTSDGSLVRTLVYTTDPHRDFSTSFKGMEVECVAFSADGRLLAAGGNEQGIKVFRLADGKVVQTFDADGAEVDGMAMSPDGAYFAHASRRSVTVRQISDWRQVHRPAHREGNAVNSIDFRSDMRYMISAGQYERVILTRISDWKEIRTYMVEPRSSIKSARFSPDGKLIAAGYGDARQVVVFRFQDGSVIRRIPMPCYIEAVAWTTDGHYLLAGGRDKGLLHVFSTADWAKVTTISAQKNASVEYIDTLGDLVVAGGEDGHIRLFRIATAVPLVEERHPIHERYWWLDEIRTVSQALGRARTGRVATWPRMTVEAGWGTLPLPEAASPVKIDGKLDEFAWQKATSLPVGPIFAGWQDGPFML